MSVGSADLHKAINTVWDASTLDATFQALRNSDVEDDEFPVLEDQEAGPGEVFPYCVYQMAEGITTDRMTGNDGAKKEIRDVPCEFRVHARVISGDSRTPKEIAAFLIEEILKVFGGHPTETPTGLTLDNGAFLISQYQTDMGLRVEDNEYQWNLTYFFRLDVPVKI